MIHCSGQRKHVLKETRMTIKKKKETRMDVVTTDEDQDQDGTLTRTDGNPTQPYYALGLMIH